MKRMLTTSIAVLALLLAACGGQTGAGESESPTAAPPVGESEDAVGDATESMDPCDPASLALKKEGTLTVATGEPAFPPWVEDDKPTNKKGFEAAFVYAVAEELGVGDVAWKRTGFDAAIAPGAKPYDFNVQQYSATPKRAKVVDFSEGYYTVEQALVAAEDSPAADAKSLADLKPYRLGAAIGTTSLDYIEEVIQPDTEAQVYDDNAAAKAAFNAKQVDAIVFDLPTAYYITSVEIPKSSIVGVLPVVGDAEQLGALFEKDSPLVPCVNAAIATLREDGTLDELEDQWLNQGGDIPTLSE